MISKVVNIVFLSGGSDSFCFFGGGASNVVVVLSLSFWLLFVVSGRVVDGKCAILAR